MHIKPFSAIRPRADLAARVSSVPYDTVNRDEARRLALGNEMSFLHVIRPEIDLPDEVDPYSPVVYRQGAEAYRAMIRRGVLVREDRPCLYLYRQELSGRIQTGVVGCCHIDDYVANRIRRHEEVRTEKLADRTALIHALDAHPGPVFLAYRDQPQIDAAVAAAAEGTPLFQFTAEDGVKHTVWKMTETQNLVEQFEQVAVGYVADGHHRAASAVQVGLDRRSAAESESAEGECNWFLAVLFPAGQLGIMAYNRCVHDLNGLSRDAFLDQLRRRVELVEGGSAVPPAPGWAGMYLDGAWYGLRLAPPGAGGRQPLDADLLQSRVLDPVLGIKNPKTDHRIHFVGGIRGTDALERNVDAGRDAVAFSMHPVSMNDVMAVADAGRVMPPKSTWFEPKLRSGLLIHSLREA